VIALAEQLDLFSSLVNIDASISSLTVLICQHCCRVISHDESMLKCVSCLNMFHLSHFDLPLSESSSWFCEGCLTTIFPYNHFAQDHNFIACALDISINSFSIPDLASGPRLDLFADHDLEHPLLNDSDPDPDANFFATRPPLSTYTTADSLCSPPRSTLGLLSLMHINARSLLSKLSDVENLLSRLSTDIVAISETWLTPDNSNQVIIPGYSLVSHPRSSQRGGGVAFLLRDTLQFQIMSLPNELKAHSTYESLFIQLNLPNGSYSIFGVIYRSPGLDLNDFLVEWHSLLLFLSRRNKDIFILGDFNIDLLRVNDHQLTSSFLDITSSHHLLPIITQPTRIAESSSTLIDNLFTNSIEKITDPSILIEDLSDHLPIYARLNILPILTPPLPLRARRRFDVHSASRFENLISQTVWSGVDTLCSEGDPSAAFDLFNELIKTSYDAAFPLSLDTIRPSTRLRQPWMTPALLKSSRTKAKLYAAFLNSPSAATKAKFVTFRNKFKSLKKLAEREYYANQFMKHGNNLRCTWNVIKSILRTKPPDSSISALTVNGSLISDPKTIAHKCNSYFSTIAHDLATALPHPSTPFQSYLGPNNCSSMAFHPTTPQEIVSLHSALKLSHTAGPDDINPAIIAPIFSQIAHPLSLRINSSMSTGLVPNAMKIAKVIPIYKQGDKDLVTNYRPISILPFFSKILEKIIHTRLLAYVQKHNFLTVSQHGFQPGQSPLLSLIDLQDHISDAIDHNHFAVGIFLDISKAFDAVNHDILLSKLAHYGIRGITLEWFTSYLSGRVQYVVCNGISSDFRPMLHGVPQGSILGPLLFLLFINDLPHSSKFLRFSLFADDTSILASDQSYPNLVALLNQELILVSNWFISNKLTLNTHKSNYILFSSHRKKPPVTHEDQIKSNQIIFILQKNQTLMTWLMYNRTSFFQLNRSTDQQIYTRTTFQPRIVHGDPCRDRNPASLGHHS
jgi:hypothetical protein